MKTSTTLEGKLELLEHAWQQNNPPDLNSIWANIRQSCFPEEVPIVWLHEIIKVDLEYRWSLRHGAMGLIEDYARLFPELGSTEMWPIDLIVEEWRARWRWGDRPGLDEYRTRFPDSPGLIVELRAAEKDVLREWQVRIPLENTTPSVLAGDPRAPLHYSDFVLNEFIGSGGVGKVYRAWHKSLGVTVAVKMLRKSRWTLPGAPESFLEEAKIAAGLRHPGIVGIHGIGRTPGGGLFLVMDWIEGSNLEEVLAVRRPAPAQAAAWIADAAMSLEHAHRQGFVHCDITPSNLLLEKTGRIFLSDFGLAMSLQAKQTTRLWAGTIGFMAPEQLDPAFGVICPATDIFALGLVLVRLLTGETIFQGETIRKALLEQPNDEIKWPGGCIGGMVPKELREVLARSLALSPVERTQSAAALAEELRQIAAIRRF